MAAQRKLAEIRATVPNSIRNESALYKRNPEFREAYDKAVKLHADLKTYGDYGFDANKTHENVIAINNSLGVKV